MQQLHKCQHCLKEFKKQGYYKKHISICEIIHCREEDATLSIEYSGEQLMDLIRHMITKQTKMENELETMKRLLKRSKNKLTVNEWINEHYREHDDFNNWFQNINVQEQDLRYVFDNNLTDGLYQIIINNLRTENDQSPLLAFIQKPNVLYAFMNKEWSVITAAQFESCVDELNSKIIQQFKIWQDDHQAELNSNKFGDDYYPNIVNKIMGGVQSRSALYSKVRSKVYHHIKINLKDVMMGGESEN